MRPIPPTLQATFIAHLRKKAVPSSAYPSYLKWLRYYLGFCEKYQLPPAQDSNLDHFLHELDQKKQSPGQQQARQAISLYYELPRVHGSVVCAPQESITTESPRACLAEPACVGHKAETVLYLLEGHVEIGLTLHLSMHLMSFPPLKKRQIRNGS